MSLFNEYASTSLPSSTRGKYTPITVTDLQSNVFVKLKKYLEDSHFEDIEVNEAYFDLYGVLNGYEYSFVITRVEGRSIIEINVYKENSHFGLKKKLKAIYHNIKELFADKQ